MPRVVSLIASATEIVCALGFEDQLVGRSHECDFPESVKRLPVCTSPKFDTGGSSRESDERIKGLVQDGLSVYRVDGLCNGTRFFGAGTERAEGEPARTGDGMTFRCKAGRPERKIAKTAQLFPPLSRLRGDNPGHSPTTGPACASCRPWLNGKVLVYPANFAAAPIFLVRRPCRG